MESVELASRASVVSWEEQCPFPSGGTLLLYSARAKEAHAPLLCDFFWEDMSKHLSTQDRALTEDQRHHSTQPCLASK